MNILLELGFLLVAGYLAGWLCHQVRLPRILGYIGTGIVLSPYTLPFINVDFVVTTEPLLKVCLAFIAFEVGGALKWSRMKRHEKEIVHITVWASIFPFILIVIGITVFGLMFQEQLSIELLILLLLALQLGALASPTAPAATLAVIHEYKARGKVTDTILGVVSLDDTFGVILFSVVINIEAFFTGSHTGFLSAFTTTLYQIGVGMGCGALMGGMMMLAFHLLPKKAEGQWIVVIASLIIICVGVCELLHIDEILAAMMMGIVIVNGSKYQNRIFKIIERYTEDLIFLFFFLLSGLHLNVYSIPHALPLILLFVLLRIAGKYLGCWWGARTAKADEPIKKYTAGGLIPQAGIVIGLVLNVYQMEVFKPFSELLLTTIMGATIINELIGPIMAKHSLKRAGEIRENNGNYENG